MDLNIPCTSLHSTGIVQHFLLLLNLQILFLLFRKSTFHQVKPVTRGDTHFRFRWFFILTTRKRSHPRPSHPFIGHIKVCVFWWGVEHGRLVIGAVYLLGRFMSAIKTDFSYWLICSFWGLWFGGFCGFGSGWRLLFLNGRNIKTFSTKWIFLGFSFFSA